MDIEIIAVVGLVFAAATASRVIYVRRMDVLHGPYIEGRNDPIGLSALSQPLVRGADRLRWKLRGMIYLASIVA
jgi:hypothetical protein